MADSNASLRWQLYTLIIAAAVGLMLAKLLGAENVIEPSRYRPPTSESFGADRAAEVIPTRGWPSTRPEPTLMFSSNDRSRWATVRALVDEGTFVIGRRVNFRDPEPPFQETGILFDNSYRSLDVVMNRETGEYYSSKPTLLPVILAGEYWLLKKLLGWSIVTDRWPVVCTILITVNILPMLVFLILTASLAEQYGSSDWGRVLLVLFASMGTLLSSFSMTLNNHLPAACCVLFAIYPLLTQHGTAILLSPLKLAISGFFAGLLPTLELPGLSLTMALFLPMLLFRPLRVLCCFGLAMLVPIAASLATEYAARGRMVPSYSEFNKPDDISEYKYPGSHWAKLGTPNAKGIDFATEPKTVYAFHLTLGHHGWFSLTPIWLFALGGLIGQAWRAPPDLRNVLVRRSVAPWTTPIFCLMTLLVSVVVFGFYIRQTNNYGGNTSGPRWLFWLIPLWLVALPWALDQVGKSRLGRGLAVLCLGLSVFSVYYPAWNPWRSPWILQWLEVNGWLVY